jgi:hypothetical protein
MRKLALFVGILFLISIPAYAYFGTSPFGQDKFGISEFDDGPYGEEVTATTPSSGDSILIETGDYLLLETGDKILLE